MEVLFYFFISFIACSYRLEQNHSLDYFWRVRLVVRTQPSQGWRTGSTPVRATTIF
jgi:hypothetical protein